MTTEEPILQLSEDERALIQPEILALMEAEQAAKAARERLTRILMFRCPEYGRDPAVQFDMDTGAFVRLGAPEAPSEPTEDE